MPVQAHTDSQLTCSDTGKLKHTVVVNSYNVLPYNTQIHRDQRRYVVECSTTRLSQLVYTIRDHFGYFKNAIMNHGDNNVYVIVTAIIVGPEYEVDPLGIHPSCTARWRLYKSCSCVTSSSDCLWESSEMASQAGVPTEDVGSPSKDPLMTLSSKVSNEQEGTIGFHFKLPLNGLALRSAVVIDGIPELRFGASPKVPTLTEEDVAIAFRLASEGKRPEFGYIQIPEWHPFYGRQYKHYSPVWLRGTSVGELMSEADWRMKCLHVGVQSNNEKSKFWSWQKKSNLDGLATKLDFPDDDLFNSIIMLCESAKVETNETEIVFPEEPKMRIVDESSSLYTKYITEIFPSVAYHDEVLFLKMQELIKLILVTEWLMKKEVKISKEWMMGHTSKSCEYTFHQSKVKEPPRMLTPPQPTEIRRPTSDVHVNSHEAEVSQCLVKRGWQRWYGWLDVVSKEMIWFDEDGSPCEKNKSMKMVVKQQISAEGLPTLKMSGWEKFPLAPTSTVVPMLTSTDANNRTSVKDQSPILQNTHEEITGPFGSMSVDVTFDDNINNKDGKEMKITRTVIPAPHISAPKVTHTTTVKASVDDYDMLYSHEDPNTPILLSVPGGCEEVCPQVQSWSELFHETVPWPHVALVPPPSVEAPVCVASGGVSTKHIPVKEEPREIRKTTSNAPRVDQYIKRDDMIGVQAQRQDIHGMLNSYY